MKKWENMTRDERKVAVAKDVIASIHAKRYSPGHQGYIEPPSGSDCLVLPDETDVQWAKRLSDSSCVVCARGAMMLSKVRKFNNAPHIKPGSFDSGVTMSSTARALSDCFTPSELEKIEATYEGWGYGGAATYVFSLDHEEPEDRLLAIMQNIIDHGGTFKPSVRYEVTSR